MIEDQELKEGITEIFNCFEKDKETKARESTHYKEFGVGTDKFKNNVFLAKYYFNNAIDTAIKDHYKLQNRLSINLHKDVYQNIITSLIKKICGITCSSDKYHWLKNRLMDFFEGREPGKDEENTYFTFKTNIALWANLVKAIDKFYYTGDFIDYAHAYLKIRENI